MYPSFFNWKNWNWKIQSSLLLTFFYKACESRAKFVTYPEDIIIHIEVGGDSHLAEVRTERAVSLTGHREIPSFVDARIASLGLCTFSLDERVVVLVVHTEQTLISLTDASETVAAKESLHVYAAVCVAVPTAEARFVQFLRTCLIEWGKYLFHILFYRY